MAKVSITGAGNVGTTTAKGIIENNLADVVLLDSIEGMPQGKALDLMQAAPVGGCYTRVIGTNDYSDVSDSDIIIITAGHARKSGMARDDLLQENAKIIKDVVKKITRYNKKAIIITVTDPVDVMTQLVLQDSKLPKHRVIGMGSTLDSARYCYFLAEALDTSPRDVRALVLGSHGYSMVPLPNYSTVSGIPVTELLPHSTIEKINRKTRESGTAIVELLKQGSAFYAPAATLREMVQSIVLDENKIVPCSVYLEGEYGVKGVYCGVPVKISKKGAGEIIELELTEEERQAFQVSANSVAENIKKLNG